MVSLTKVSQLQQWLPYTVFMLIERMIQLLQENSILVIVCIPLERKPLPVIIFYESN